MKKKTAIILSITAVLLIIAILVIIIAVNKSRDVDVPEPTAKPTAAPTVEEPTVEPTEEPTAEPTAEPTPEPTADPAALRDVAIAEQDAIEETMQAQIDLVTPLLEVVKGLPNFEETPVYTNISWASSQLESYMLEGDINDVVSAYNYLIFTVNNLLAEYPELTETEEFQNLLDAPTFDIAIYNSYVAVYNSALANSTSNEFEKLPYCINEASSIEY